MKYGFYVFILVISILFGSCESSKNINNSLSDVMNSWKGSTKHQLILSWGAPTRTTSDGNGGEILVYDKVLPAPPSPFPSSYGRPNLLISSRMFYVNNQGVIYHWVVRNNVGN